MPVFREEALLREELEVFFLEPEELLPLEPEELFPLLVFPEELVFPLDPAELNELEGRLSLPLAAPETVSTRTGLLDELVCPCLFYLL